jgi:hypothetical protein
MTGQTTGHALPPCLPNGRLAKHRADLRGTGEGKGANVTRIRASLTVAIGLSVAACSAGPEIVVPAYVSPNAYIDTPCEEIITRLQAVEAAYRAERASRRSRPLTLGRTPPPDQRMLSRARVERDALREAARRKACARPSRCLVLAFGGAGCL